jgi:1-acyl-sn-glycerol-3-phosphate acyltransferase
MTPSSSPSIPRIYRLAMAVCSPLIRWWGRLEVTGAELLPEHGPLLLAVNHDSNWDPVAVGISGLPRRQIRALAKVSLWKTPGLGWLLDGMGQIPIERGTGDTGAMDRAVAELRAGACLGIFPEGTRTRGRVLRARSGFGRLAQAVPEATVICVAVEGAGEVMRLRPRPRVSVQFFLPAEGGLRPDERPAELSRRLLAEIRARVPIPSLRADEEIGAEADAEAQTAD